MSANSAAAPAAALARILSAFEAQPEAAREALKRWNRTDPEQLASTAVQHLAAHPIRPAERYLARLMAMDNVAVRWLLNAALGAEQAVAAARVLIDVDSEFCRKLTDACDRMNTPEAITRAFDIIASLNRIPVVVPWLQRMTRHSDAHVQSKASLIFCRLYGNPMLVERQLGSADNRVRANAIEALWNIDTLAARNILDKAARDGHHRVAANAVLGLYLLRSPGAAERLTEMASSESASFRASAAWAMGQTGDDAFQPLLRTLLSDEAENVRGAAQRALERLHCGEPAHAAV